MKDGKEYVVTFKAKASGDRAVQYRRINRIPDEWGTAVNVQRMVFGNMGNNSATGVAFVIRGPPSSAAADEGVNRHSSRPLAASMASVIP